MSVCFCLNVPGHQDLVNLFLCSVLLQSCRFARLSGGGKFVAASSFLGLVAFIVMFKPIATTRTERWDTDVHLKDNKGSGKTKLTVLVKASGPTYSL